ncbi:MFS transporter [Microbacterium arabinogalactanolyticum]|uniref:MFS transporter n=1 Tax=Microbacterium arabinogalactanolyticum TaxID=69365 RepID=UPI002557183F|nr:MFS transporter [Microbacterium arabinogalactanolyticum]GLC85582.1 MFS transporter [Microbacterium arabinogalactanolyticum]
MQKRTLTAWKATIAVAMSNYIEAGAIIALATSLTLWQGEFGFDDGAVGLVAALSANAFGAAIGAAVGGPLCDRLGRKFIYTYDLIVFMIGALMVTFSPNFAVLLVGVVLMGIAVGAGVPASWTYIAEEAPSEQRAAHVGTAQLAWSIGPAIGFLLAVVLGPLGIVGSRIIFFHLFVIAAVTWWVRRDLPESARWKAQRETAQEQGEKVSLFSGIRGLLSDRRNLGALLFLLGVYGLWNTVAGQAGIFQPRVYDAAGLHDATQQNLLQVLVWTLTAAATYFGFMRFGDRVSRRWLYFGGALLGVIAWVVLVFAPPGLASLLFFAIAWGISAGIGAQAFYGLWTAELFATKYRASAQGMLFMLARVMVGLLSLVFPVLLTSWGLPQLGMLIIGLLVAALLIGTIWAPRTEGKSLEQIERERYGERVDADLV